MQDSGYPTFPIVPVVPKHQPVLMPTPDDSMNSNETSNNSSLNNLDDNDIRLKSGSISRQRKRSSITAPSPKDDFRKRVFSSDSVQADRNRARSMDMEQGQMFVSFTEIYSFYPF